MAHAQRDRTAGSCLFRGKPEEDGVTCLTALAAEPGGTPTATGGRVTACSVLAVAAFPAASSMETRGTTWDGAGWRAR